MWVEEYERFDIGLEKFGFDIGAINETPTVHERVVCCWIEDLGNRLITSNRDASNLRLLQKYKVVFFTDIDTNNTFKILCEKCNGIHSEVAGSI